MAHKQLVFFLILNFSLTLFFIHLVRNLAQNEIDKTSYGVSPSHQSWTAKTVETLTQDIEELYNHTFTGYMRYAFPADELRPLTCVGKYRDPNNLDDFTSGNFSLTLVDALDSLVIFNRTADFWAAVRYISGHDFVLNLDVIVSTFEMNIRVLGGLLSGHFLATALTARLINKTGWNYKGELLARAILLGKTLLRAFDTPSGLPSSRIHLRSGEIPVAKNHNPLHISTAEAGSFLIEFGTLSLLTDDPRFYKTAKNAVLHMWSYRSPLNLVPGLWDVMTGSPLGRYTGVGAGSDSFFEYLLKAAILFGDDELYVIFTNASSALHRFCQVGGYYFTCNTEKGGSIGLPSLNALGAFWPGIQMVFGHVQRGIKTFGAYYDVWKQRGVLPEEYKIMGWSTNNAPYLLRPEFLESTFYLARLGGTSVAHHVAQITVDYFRSTLKTKCGLASQRDTLDASSLMNEMPSYVLSETLVYLYLLVLPPTELNRRLPFSITNAIFSTEAHLFPLPWKLPGLFVQEKTETLSLNVKQRLCRMTESRSFSCFKKLNCENSTPSSPLLQLFPNPLCLKNISATNNGWNHRTHTGIFHTHMATNLQHTTQKKALGFSPWNIPDLTPNSDFENGFPVFLHIIAEQQTLNSGEPTIPAYDFFSPLTVSLSNFVINKYRPVPNKLRVLFHGTLRGEVSTSLTSSFSSEPYLTFEEWVKMESFSKLWFKPDTMTRHQLKSILLNRTFLQSYKEETQTRRFVKTLVAAYPANACTPLLYGNTSSLELGIWKLRQQCDARAHSIEIKNYIRGQIVVVRGEQCGLDLKLQHLDASGAAAAIILQAKHTVMNTLDAVPHFPLPVIFISSEDSQLIRYFFQTVKQKALAAVNTAPGHRPFSFQAFFSIPML